MQRRTDWITRRRVGRLAAAVAVGAAIAVFAFVLPRIASYGAVWRDVHALTWLWIGALTFATVLNVVTFAPPWMAVLPGLGFLRALSMTQVSTAFSLVMPGGAPVGMAASFAALRSWGFAARRVGLAVSLSGIWSQLSVFAFPVVAVALLATQGGVSGSLWLIATVGVILFAAATVVVGLVLSYSRLAFGVGELAAWTARHISGLIGRPPPAWSGQALVRFRSDTLDILRRRWLALTVATLANQLTGFLLLELSMSAVGISQRQVSLAEGFAAWSLGRLLVSLPLTPGGVGFVELGLTGTLIGFGGPNSRVVAAVLIYRALSIFPTLALGLAAALTWRFQTPRARHSAPAAQNVGTS